MVGVLNVSMEFTRKHGFNTLPCFPCTVEDCSLAGGKDVGHSKSAARMNRSVGIYLHAVDKANKVVESGIVINDTFLLVLPLTISAKRVIASNIPPFIMSF